MDDVETERRQCPSCRGAGGAYRDPYVEPVSVTVFLGRDNTWAEAITRALTEGDGE